MSDYGRVWSLLVIGSLPDSQATLEDQGTHVLSFENPDEAYDAFIRQRFEAVLLVAELPELHTWLARFQRLTPDVPLLVIGAADAEAAQSAMEAGAFGVLTGEPEPDRLRRLLTQARIFRRLGRERRRALENSQATRRFYEDILMSVSDGILVCDRHGRLRFRNKIAQHILEEHDSDDELEGESTTRHRTTVSQILQQLATTLAEGREEQSVLNFEDDNQRVHLEVTTTHLKTADNRTDGAIAVLRDRSTERLLEQQLMHTERLATLGGLLAAIAHDINNPLTAITQGTEIGLMDLEDLPFKEPLSEEAQEWVEGLRTLFEDIQKTGLRCQGIANNLLAYSRQARIESSPRCDVNALIRKTVDFVGRYQKLEELEVCYRLGDGLALAAVNESEISQALTNLIDNAVQAMEDSPRKQLTLRSESDGRSIVVEIADTGPGIPEKRLKKIFKPFFTTKGSGTGLGLHITRRVIENQNGTISVESEVGVGTRFTIVLPLR